MQRNLSPYTKPVSRKACVTLDLFEECILQLDKDFCNIRKHCSDLWQLHCTQNLT